MKQWKQAVAMFVMALFIWTPSLATAEPRLIPEGSVNILSDSGVDKVIRSEVPLPENVMMKCQGECLIQAEKLQALVRDGTVFSAAQTREGWNMKIDSGRMDFALRRDSTSLVFYTPHGVLETEPTDNDTALGSIPVCIPFVVGAGDNETREEQESRQEPPPDLNSLEDRCDDEIIRGYIIVTEDEAQLVLEEGCLIVFFAGAECLLYPGEGVSLAHGVLVPLGAAAGIGGTAAIVGGVAGAAGIAGIAGAVATSDDDDEPEPVSPDGSNTTGF